MHIFPLIPQPLFLKENLGANMRQYEQYIHTTAYWLFQRSTLKRTPDKSLFWKIYV